MSATARRLNGRHHHEVEIGDLRFAAGVPTSDGAVEWAPTPQELLAASLAACSTLTMEAYAKRKGWDIGDVAVEVDYGQQAPALLLGEVFGEADDHGASRGAAALGDLSVAAKSPVHRTLEGETMFNERLELTLPHAAAANGHQARPPSDNNALLRRFLRPYRWGRRAQQEGARRGQKLPHSGLRTKRPLRHAVVRKDPRPAGHRHP